MNKTVTINLSGIVFHIDENAYDTLKKYLESIRSKFTVADGRDEIVSDIEARIAEMFQQRISDNKQAILPEDVNAVITILGKPEDISNSPETASATETVAGDNVYHVKKRFFRSPDDKILGGVCGGISAYFDIDPIWLRLAFALGFFFGGSGILIYIILWAIVPLAKTPSEKLQMHGEDVTLSAIQKSVQDELEGVKTKAGEMVSEMRAKNYGRRLSDFIRDVVVMFFKFIGRLFSVIAIVISLVMLFILTVLLLCVFGLCGFAAHNHTLMMLAPRSDMFLGLIGLLLLLGVPTVLLFLGGLKRLFKINWNLKKAGAILGGLMLIGVGICLITAYNVSKYYAADASVYKTMAWQVPAKKVLTVKLNPKNLKVTSVVIGNGAFSITDEDEDSLIHSRVWLKFEQSNTDSVEMEVKFIARGRNHSEAYALAKKIQYGYSVTDTTLMLDPYCNLGQGNGWRGQKVALTLRIPVGTSIKLDHNLSVNDFTFEISAMDDITSDEFYGHIFTMTNDGLKCLDCNDMPDDDNSILKHQHITL
jgi:phage shock protein PspC (stress-responsive transcriptional regulator)